MKIKIFRCLLKICLYSFDPLFSVVVFNKTKLQLLSSPLLEPVKSPHYFSGEANPNWRHFICKRVNSSLASWLGARRRKLYWVQKSSLLKLVNQWCSVLFYQLWFTHYLKKHAQIPDCKYVFIYLLHHSILSRKLTIWRTPDLGPAQPSIHWDLPSEPKYVCELPNQSTNSVSSRLLKPDLDRCQWS